MLLTVSFLSALVGVGFAGAAALMSDTGIDGTTGGYLALAGAVAVAILIGLPVFGWVSSRKIGLIVGVAGLIVLLTGLAAWFLMQNGLLATMVLSLLTLVLSALTSDRKKLA